MLIPKKSLGQNFLIDQNIINKIIKISKIQSCNILEIGPGLGALTDKILQLKPNNFIIIEKDNYLYKKLLEKYKKNKVIILNDDALKINYQNFKNFKIISNLPYNISSKFLLKTLPLNKNFSEIFCMMQYELAEKFNYNKTKNNKYKFISEYCSSYSIKFNVPNSVFYPKPKVKSSFVHFKLKKRKIEIEKLNYFIRNFFINKRKKIKSNKIFKNQINKKFNECRFEELSYNDLLNIYEKLKFSIS